MSFEHKSVLLSECIENLNIKPDGIYVDGTLGGAGHSVEILKMLNPNGLLIGIDQDKEALEASVLKLSQYGEQIDIDCIKEIYTNTKEKEVQITKEERLKNTKEELPKFTVIKSNFENLKEILTDLGISKVDGILLDIGVSSYQLDEAKRGFSYMKDAPLDMRMDSDSDFSAYDIINGYSEKELFRIIKTYGEENWASRIAAFIVERRKINPVSTTGELVNIIEAAIPKKARQEKSHPAKRTFQAVRIEVNRELEVLNKVIEDAVHSLNNGGRLAVITFHSLEDRIVKVKFNEMADPCTCPKDFPVCVCKKVPCIKILTRKPIIPSEEELLNNSRAKSSKLRVVENIHI